MQGATASNPLAPSQPEVLATRVDGAVVHIELRIPENLCYFEGHFPDCSLLPGVVQMDWAIAFGRKHFAEYFAQRPRFDHLANVKFMRVIVPGKVVTLRLREIVDRGELGFEYCIDDVVCSSGQLGFVN
jgi:3-hydroxymyristoyl/3-hydroxydecanoyl-(acyl carrier protein) dehydratase